MFDILATCPEDIVCLLWVWRKSFDFSIDEKDILQIRI